MGFNIMDVTIRTVLMLAIALFLTIMTVAGVRLLKIDIKDFKQRTGPRFMLVALIANLLFIFSVYLLMDLMDNRNIELLGFSLSLIGMVYSILALLLTVATGIVFVYIINRREMYQVRFNPEDFLKKSEWGSFLLSFIVLFVAALQEEIMFRGYLSFIFQQYNLITSMLVSTVIFTVWHFIGNKVNRYQAFDWLIGGLLLFFVYIESGSIWVTAIVHFSRNLTNVLVFDIAQTLTLFKWRNPIAPKHKTVYILICSIIITIFTMVYF